LPPDAIQGERYLGVIVNNQKELLPRQALVSGFFAMRAGVAESVAVGSITADKLGAASITTEKVAAGAVTGDKLAASVITTDKIANGAVTQEKLSADVQQKLAQTGGLPAAVATLNVTEKLKVGKNSLYLNGTAQPVGTPDNSIHTDNGALSVQSKTGNDQNTVINANNAGKVGIGTNDPKDKLNVAGRVLISHSPWSVGRQPGLELYFDQNPLDGSDITSILNASPLTFSQLNITGSPIVVNSLKDASSIGTIDLTGNPIILNSRFAQSASHNVGIGTRTPRARLDIVGGIRTAKGDSIQGDVANVGYAFESDGDTGMFSYGGTTTGGSTLAFKVDNSRMLGIGRWGVSIGETWMNNLPEGTGGGLARFFLTPGDAGYANFWLNQASGNFRWDDTAKKFKRDEAQYNGFRGFMFYGDHTTHFIHADYYNPTNEWSFQDIHKLARFTITGNAFGINNPTPSYDYALDVGGRVRATAFVPGSDKRWKKDIKPLENALSKVDKLQGVSYQWKTEEYPNNGFNDKPQIGFIAQDVEPVLPELVSTDEKGFKGVEYDKMTAVLVEAVKELKGQNEALKAIVCKDHPRELICQ